MVGLLELGFEAVTFQRCRTFHLVDIRLVNFDLLRNPICHMTLFVTKPYLSICNNYYYNYSACDAITTSFSEYDEDPVAVIDQLEMTLFALQSWCLLPVYAVPESDREADEDVIVGE